VLWYGQCSAGSGQEPVAGCCKNVNGHLSSMEGEGFLELLSDCRLLNEDLFHEGRKLIFVINMVFH
jgi:hypothetical protein